MTEVLKYIVAPIVVIIIKLAMAAFLLMLAWNIVIPMIYFGTAIATHISFKISACIVVAYWALSTPDYIIKEKHDELCNDDS